MTMKMMTWNSGRNSPVEVPKTRLGSVPSAICTTRGMELTLLFGPLPLVTCYPFYAVQNGSPLRYAVVAEAP